MRILELCAPSASAEVQVQINALREAFSQDTTKPFELKPNLGLRSPSSDGYPTPATITTSHNPSFSAGTSWQHLQDANAAHTLPTPTDYAPPLEATTVPGPVMPFTSMPLPPQAPYSAASTSAPSQGYPVEVAISTEQTTPVWDPSGIFQQWNTAFGAQAPPQQSPVAASRINSIAAMTNQPVPPPQQNIYAARQTPPNVVPEMNAMPTVTPVMWQDAFTNAYVSGHGNKRYRDESVDYAQYSKRRG
jgi:hypothetical protein